MAPKPWFMQSRPLDHLLKWIFFFFCLVGSNLGQFEQRCWHFGRRIKLSWGVTDYPCIPTHELIWQLRPLVIFSSGLKATMQRRMQRSKYASHAAASQAKVQKVSAACSLSQWLRAHVFGKSAVVNITCTSNLSNVSLQNVLNVGNCCA